MEETNILRKFDWNNRKSMPKEKLHKEFSQLSPEDSARVVEYLSLERRNILEKSLDEYTRQQEQVELKKVLDIISDVFEFFVSTDEIKSIDDAALIATLLIDHAYDTPSQKGEKHANREAKSFEALQGKILDWIDIFIDRNQVNPSNRRGPILEATRQMVSELKHIPTDETFSAFATKRRELYKYVLKNSGMGESSAGTIASGIIKFIEWLHGQKNSPVTLSPAVEEIKNICLDNSGDCEQKILDIVKRSKYLLSIDDNNDNFSSVQIKKCAMKVLLPDSFQERGKELYKVNCPVKNYPLSLDLRLFNIDGFIKQEAELFKKFGKPLTDEHIEHIREAHRILQELPKSEEELKESQQAYIDI